MDITIAPPQPAERETFLAAVARSRELHHPWVAPPTDPDAFDGWVAGVGERLASWLVRDGDRLVGVVNANEIVRRASTAPVWASTGSSAAPAVGASLEASALS